MKTGLLRLFGLTMSLLVFTIPMLAQAHRQKPYSCMDSSNMSQLDMNGCAAKELHDSELKLERLLKHLGIANTSPEQKAWEAYRDAQLGAICPQQDTSSYGSVYPMCFAILKRTLTESRIRDLKDLITSGEGDVCRGYRAPPPGG